MKKKKGETRSFLLQLNCLIDYLCRNTEVVMNVFARSYVVLSGINKASATDPLHNTIAQQGSSIRHLLPTHRTAWNLHS